MSGVTPLTCNAEGPTIDAGILEEEDEVDESLNYQTALRAIGAWLDSHGADSGIRILETTGGFVVQRAEGHIAGIGSSQTITFDQVWELAEGKKYRKRSKGEDGGFQNFLRAVGHELDEAEAHTILLEQIDEELLLTYIYPRYQGGISFIKHFTVIAPEARQDLLRAAQERRKPGRLTKGLIRFIGDA